MIQSKIIDLSNNKEGVTLYFKLKNIGNAFFILIKDADSPEQYYKREYDLPNLKVNLPVHPKRICVLVVGAELDTWIIRKIDIYKIPYQVNEKIRIPRSYALGDIKIRKVRGLPEGSEARFLYDEGVIEWDVDRCAGMAQPVFNFILDHEVHHYFYGRPIPVPEELAKMPQAIRDHFYQISLEDESECDRGALYAGINKGYNFSGILHGLMGTLNASHYNVSRIISIHNEICRMHKKLEL
ncbi:MAG: hypothetical protein V4721_16585 [Bacteroidota bacterium]